MEPETSFDSVSAKRPRITRIDRYVLAAAMVFLFLLLLPVFFSLREQNYYRQCQSNLKSLGEALQQYMQDNGLGLPSAYAMNEAEGGGQPAWIVGLYSYLEKKNIIGASPLTCPTASFDEQTVLHGPHLEGIQLSYGFYVGVSGAHDSDVTDKFRTAVMAETCGGGRGGSYDPMPRSKQDGYLIGFDDNDEGPTAKSHLVTRLATSRLDTNKGWDNGENLWARHGSRGLNVLYFDGHIDSVAPSVMILRRGLAGVPLAPWPKIEKH